MRRYLKIFLYLVLLFIGIAVTGTVLVYYNQDKIIKLFVNKANQHLEARIYPKDIRVNLFDNFPDISIVFEDITIYEAVPESNEKLATAGQLGLAFSVWDLWQEHYRIQDIYLAQADVNLKIFEDGTNNFTLVKQDTTDTTSSDKKLKFDLNAISLNEVAVRFENRQGNQVYDFFAKKARAGFSLSGDATRIYLDGDLRANLLRIGQQTYLRNKALSLDGTMVHDYKEEQFNFKNIDLGIDKGEFKADGFYDTGEEQLDLSLKGINTNLKTLIALIPRDISKTLEPYRSRGKIYFDGSVKGNVGQGNAPTVKVNFGCSNTAFYHPDLNQNIEDVSLNGYYTNGSQSSPQTSRLKLKNIEGKLDQKTFTGMFSMQNFEDPYVSLEANGTIDIAKAMKFYEVPEISNGGGTLDMNVSFEGRINRLKGKHPTRHIKASGEVSTNNLRFKVKNSPQKFHSFNTHFLFNKNDVAISQFEGAIGKSDFKLNGYFKNVIPYLFFEDESIYLNADFSSDAIYLDKLLALQAVLNKGGSGSGKSRQQDTTSSEQDKYFFSISPRLHARLDIDVDRLTFQRFYARNLKSTLRVRDKVASFDTVQVKLANGEIHSKGLINARSKKHITINAHSWFKGIAIDSVFYSFENFQQKFLTYNNLNGNVSADLRTYLVMDSTLNFDYNKMVVYSQSQIVNGRLYNFEPLQRLSVLIDEEKLADIRFDTLENNIHIENNTLHMPEMAIRSSIANLFVEGEHVLGGDMDYRIKIPLKSLSASKADKDEKYGPVREDLSGNPSLFLKVAGTTEDFKVKYDSKRVKEKIKKDLKEEKKEFVDLFKKKDSASRAREGDDVQLEEDQYFEFGEDEKEK